VGLEANCGWEKTGSFFWRCYASRGNIELEESIFPDFAFIPFEKITRGPSCSEFVTVEMQLSCVAMEMEIGVIRLISM